MRSADIKIGEKYKVGYYGGGEVLETRVDRHGRRDGVRIRFFDGYRKGKECVIASRNVDELWSAYEARKQATEQRRAVAKRDHEKMLARAGELKGALEGVGVEVRRVNAAYGMSSDTEEGRATFELGEEAIGRLIALLGEDKIAERGEQIDAADPTADPLAELLV